MGGRLLWAQHRCEQRTPCRWPAGTSSRKTKINDRRQAGGARISYSACDLWQFPQQSLIGIGWPALMKALRDRSARHLFQKLGGRVNHITNSSWTLADLARWMAGCGPRQRRHAAANHPLVPESRRICPAQTLIAYGTLGFRKCLMSKATFYAICGALIIDIRRRSR